MDVTAGQSVAVSCWTSSCRKHYSNGKSTSRKLARLLRRGKKAAEAENPGGEPERNGRVKSARDGIAALAVLALGGIDGQPHLFADGPREESS